tara:strand:+ start:1494 stop:1811 length:318 start_codon:yes stop_codon:yes gene_type:complete
MLCPLCENETKSKNKGLIRHRECRVCQHQFKTIEVLFEEPMSATEKINQFMAERKTPQTSAIIADYFLLAQATVNQSLKELEKQGAVQKKRVGKRYVWRGVYCGK